MERTVKCKGGTNVSLGEVVRAKPGAAFTWGVRADDPEGGFVSYALDDREAAKHGVKVGERVLVEYSPEGQFATIVDLRRVAKALGHEVAPVVVFSDTMRDALKHADRVLEIYGLNVRGCALDYIKTAFEYECDVDTREQLEASEAWEEYGADVMRDDERTCCGHMSERDVSVLQAEAKELVELAVQEFDTLAEIEEVLK